jgi:hypothetical protein
VARRHEQPVAVAAAEADVGGALGQRYEADRLAGGIEHLDAVERGAHAPAAPQIAVDVDPKAVGVSSLSQLMKMRPLASLAPLSTTSNI